MAAKPPRWIYFAASIFWLLVGGLLGWAFKPAPSAGQFEQPSPAVIVGPAFPGARVTWVGSGTWRVPVQVQPGSYIVAAGTSSAFGCTWIRLSADDDKPKSEIDSGSVNRGGFDRFTVAPSDRVLRLLGDCTWARL